MRLAGLTPKLIDLARRRGSVITRADIERLGGTTNHVTRLTRSGIIVRVHAGVYVLGGTPIDHLVQVRAALAALRGNGADAMASHNSAAWIQGLIDRPPSRVHVTTGPVRRHLIGVTVHGTKYPPNDRRRFREIECTPPARTLVDLAATAIPTNLADAVDRALANGLVRIKDLIAHTKRPHGSRAGTDRLRRCLEDRGDTNVPSPSVLESKMARLATRYGLPEAKAEHVAGSDGEYRIDYSYLPHRVAVELYGYTYHRSPDQLQYDQARQRKLMLDEGWTVLVFTWRDVLRDPAKVAREIRQALAQTSRNPKYLKVDNHSQL